MVAAAAALPFALSGADVMSGLGMVGQLIGGIGANSAASKAADKANDFTMHVLRNRHQLETQDLRAAGLNPILSANGGGPGASGAMYTPQNPAAGMAEGATHAATASSQRSLIKAQIEATNASAQASLASANNMNSEATLKKFQFPGAANQAAADSSAWAKFWSLYGKQGTGAIGDIGNAVGALAGPAIGFSGLRSLLNRGANVSIPAAASKPKHGWSNPTPKSGQRR